MKLTDAQAERILTIFGSEQVLDAELQILIDAGLVTLKGKWAELTPEGEAAWSEYHTEATRQAR